MLLQLSEGSALGRLCVKRGPMKRNVCKRGLAGVPEVKRKKGKGCFFISLNHVPSCFKPLDLAVNRTEMGCCPYRAHTPNSQQTVFDWLLKCRVLTIGSYSPGSLPRTALVYRGFEQNR